MLVFLSDTHLTDVPVSEGSGATPAVAETLQAGAFRKFAVYLQEMAEHAGAKEVEIVFLGDTLDVIRSPRWLRTSIRPWSPPGERDDVGKNLEDYTMEVLEAICTNPTNCESMGHLAKFRQAMEEEGEKRPVKLTYLIGNHDWLINRYQKARSRVAQFLGMTSADQDLDQPFPAERLWERYGVFARHGDLYDPLNYDGCRDAASLGDAIVIDLLTRFAVDVEHQLGTATDPTLVALLREIDNVRPIADIPLWVQGACRQATSAAVAKKVKEVWNELADGFLKIPFVREHDRPWWPDAVDALQWGLKISRFLSVGALANLPLRRIVPSGDDYAKHAYAEDSLQTGEADFVVFGHTHRDALQPLELVSGRSTNTLRRTYFNTGTWRRVHERAAYDPDRCDFLSWHEMTFVAFYLEDERKDKSFELWHGALG
jgi:UDP-2,3-diacylglucosamine pyrophosphatase LpxH